MTTSYASHSSSKKWISPAALKKEQFQKYNRARHDFCRQSVAWPPNYDIHVHREEFNEDVRAQWEKKAGRTYADRKERQRLGLGSEPPKPKPPFGGRRWETKGSAVLGVETVFVPEGDRAPASRTKPVPDWPSSHEWKYEGDERIATDRLHGRCLCAMRVPGNRTVTWMQRSVVPPFEFDDFEKQRYDELFIFCFGNWIHEQQVSDQEGRYVLGNELMDLLDE